MLKIKNFIMDLYKNHRLLFLSCIIFTLIHLFLWTHYYASYYGWVKKMDILDPFFLLTGIIYWFIYLSIIYLFYTYGKAYFLFILFIIFFSLMLTIPFSLAKVDLGVKFALLLKDSLEWDYLENYINWIIMSLLLAIILLAGTIYCVNKFYHDGLKSSKLFQIILWPCLLFISIWHIKIDKAIDTEIVPAFYYDNEIGRVLRVLVALGTEDFKVFEYKNLLGSFILKENQKINTPSIHGVLAILDTLEYEFLSIHGNKSVPLNKDLQFFINQGSLVDLGIVYSCGSHTTASLPNILSMNHCQIGPKFHSEPIMHLMKRIGVENHYIGAEGLSQYFATIFSLDASENNRHYILYPQTPHALSITAQDIKNYPLKPSSFTMVYYDAVHPGIKCSFLTGGGLPESSCKPDTNFQGPLYQDRMNKSVKIIEQDIVDFIKQTENLSQPIFIILTSDHGLSPNFLHGDMADSDVSLDDIEHATQRHANVLIYGNKAYRSINKISWNTLKLNAINNKSRLNHTIIFPSLISAMDIKWSEGQDIITKQSVFSKNLQPIWKQNIPMNRYLTN